MKPFWDYLRKNNLISEEKHKRLLRNTPFTEDEEWGFINRQLVETRQSTKVISELLKEKYPETEIVYVKAGLVSEFRQNNKVLKSRAINDLHHAKDAYLNIVCGNVYHEKFTKKWFYQNFGSKDFSINSKVLFNHKFSIDDREIWRGQDSLEEVIRTVGKNNIHMTFYSVMKHHGQNGGFFDQNPLRKGKGSIPRKADLPAEKYGGYNGCTTSFSVLVKYNIKKKTEIEFVPVTLLVADRFLQDNDFAIEYVKNRVGDFAENIEFLFNKRPIKIGTVIEVDGLRILFAGQGSKETMKVINTKTFTPLIIAPPLEQYVKAIESFVEKSDANDKLVYNEEHDKLSIAKNIELFDSLLIKMNKSLFNKRPECQVNKICEKKEIFEREGIKEQCQTLLNMISLFNRVSKSDKLLGTIGDSRLNCKLSNWKQYQEVYLIDMSPSGIWQKKSINLKEML